MKPDESGLRQSDSTFCCRMCGGNIVIRVFSTSHVKLTCATCGQEEEYGAGRSDVRPEPAAE